MKSHAHAAPRKPVSSNQRGAYYKGRVKRWLLSQGYQVSDMEKVYWIHTPAGRIPTKRDQMGSDLLAVDTTVHGDRPGVIFIQVKGGRTCRQGIPPARREFRKHVFPDTTRQWIVCWDFGARAPEVVEMPAPLPLT